MGAGEMGSFYSCIQEKSRAKRIDLKLPEAQLEHRQIVQVRRVDREVRVRPDAEMPLVASI
jgi:hypothetical protein